MFLNFRATLNWRRVWEHCNPYTNASKHDIYAGLSNKLYIRMSYTVASDGGYKHKLCSTDENWTCIPFRSRNALASIRKPRSIVACVVSIKYTRIVLQTGTHPACKANEHSLKYVSCTVSIKSIPLSASCSIFCLWDERCEGKGHSTEPNSR